MGVDFRQPGRGPSAEWAFNPFPFPARIHDWATNVAQVGGTLSPEILSCWTKMTESSANKLLNGDVCPRTSRGRKASKNGFVKNHCLFQEPQKYRRPRGKVRPGVILKHQRCFFF